MIVWIMALAKGRKIALYCSDVSGAFDRVQLERLEAKLKAKKIHATIIDVLVSWLRKRRAKVVVGGEASEEFDLENMVFQGTVLGPPLWNIFYEDAKVVVNELFFEESVYADDLNAYRIFPGVTPNDKILASLKACQQELHDWGDANQVQFDSGKEGLRIIAGKEAQGDDFKILGVEFDVSLSMERAVNELVLQANWKLIMIIRTRRFYTDGELVLLYKSHLLSFLEYRTPAIYHVTRDILVKLDRVQSKFLEDAGIDEAAALMHFNLAPLTSRRDIAMLGVLHRRVIGKGAPHFKKHFELEAGRRLRDPRTTMKGPLVIRSIFGLVAVYNMIPEMVRQATTVKQFQAELQGLLKKSLNDGRDNWKNHFHRDSGETSAT
jgi:hypothetical protein